MEKQPAKQDEDAVTGTTTTQRTEMEPSRTTGPAATGTTGARDVRTADSGTMRAPETAERLRVDQRETEQGQVQVRKRVESEQVTVPVDLPADDEATIEKRLGAAGRELGAFWHYDYAIVNDDLDACVRELKSIIRAARCAVPVMAQRAREIEKTFQTRETKEETKTA